MTSLRLKIGGMHCAACAVGLQKALLRNDAVSSAAVNIATEIAAVEFDDKRISYADIESIVKRAGFYVVRDENDAKNELKSLQKSLIVSAVFAIPLFYIAMGPHDRLRPAPAGLPASRHGAAGLCADAAVPCHTGPDRGIRLL